jgi:3-oxoadipate CoA-transferase alpha subunit
MINKLMPNLAQAVADVPDGATVMIGGFGTAGLPNELTEALIEQGARDLVIVNNNAGNGETGLAALIKAKRVRKIICSFPRQADSHHFDAQYRSGELELELVPQGNLAERINGRPYVLEYPIHADFAFIKAERGDRWGNLTYRMTARNFGPVMATAARVTVATVHEVVELGSLDPEAVVTPGLFVQRVVQIDRQATQAGGLKERA